MSGESGGIKRVGGKLVYSGPIASVRMDRFQHPDGSKATRQVVVHPGAVAIVAHDQRVLFMVRQPREAVGEADLLELPAGKLDVDGETPLFGEAAGDPADADGLGRGLGERLRELYVSAGGRRFEAGGV